MAKQLTIKQQYYQQRKRIERYYRKYEKEGYERTDKALPSIPKKITEASVRRLQGFTPEKMQKNLISPFYYSELSAYKPYKELTTRTLYEEKHKTNFSYTEQKLLHINYPTILQTRIRPEVRELKPAMYQYYKDIEDTVDINISEGRTPYAYANDDKSEWTRADYEIASDRMQLDYKDMTDEELSDMDLMKTDDGFIISTNTGEIIARDMSKEIAKNNEFVDDLVEEGYLPADFEWEDLTESKKDLYEKSPLSEKSKQAIYEHSFNTDDTTIYMFMANLRRYSNSAYPYLSEIILGFWAEGGDNPDTKHAIAVAIEKTVSEYGWVTREIAYTSERLSQYGSSLLSNFNISQSAEESLNNSLEEEESYLDEE